MKIQKQAEVGSYRAAGFIGDYQKLVRETVIPYQYEVLCDRAGTEKSHVIANFKNAAAALRGEDIGDGFYGMVFQDSDAAKWLEAAAYSLAGKPDSELEARADELISLIASAQDEDGYLNTCFTIKDRDRRWQNLLEGHEMYCSGHLFEAGAAYCEATGKRELLDVCLKNAAHIYKRFITDGAEGYPGHPEIELALMKLYRVSGDERCRELAEHFVNVRGVDPDFYKRERDARDWTVWGNNAEDGEYQQSARPVRELSDASGHAVRAVYLYTAMADLASELGDAELTAACERLWDSITQKRMYITGGIGATVHGEAFSVDYDLPSDTAYAESCASVGLMFFASRMLEGRLYSGYADVMEMAFYNTVLAGMARDGKSFYYVNPLESVRGIAGEAPTQRHDLPQRPSWYACACCPPNIARTVMSLGKYAYGESADTAYCHLYAAGEVSLKNGIAFTCETDYPFGGTVTYKIKKGGRIAVRLPHWSVKNTVKRNGKSAKKDMQGGYAFINARDGDEIVIELDMKPRLIYPSVKVPALSGRVCVCRGPLVYCFESIDNDGDILGLSVSGKGITECTVSGLEGIPALAVPALRTESSQNLYSDIPPRHTPFLAAAIPYFCRANRGETDMRVWMPYIRDR